MNFDGSHSKQSPGEVLRRAFRERQVYVRSDGGLRYLVVRPWHLVLGTCLCAASLGWLSVSTFTFLYNADEISDARNRTERVQVLYDRRLATMQTAVERLNEKLMLDQGAYIGKVEALRSDFVRLADRQRRLEIFFKQGWLPAKVLDGTLPGPTPKPHSDNRREDNQREDDQREDNQREDKQPIVRATAPAGEFRTRAEAEQPIAEIQQGFAAFEATQMTLVARILEFGENKAADLRKVFTKLGLDPVKVAARVKLPKDATGGPLLPVQTNGQPHDYLDRQLLKAHKILLEAEKLRHAITMMPVRLPFDKGYRLTSGFGFRRDPIKDVLAMHTGVDLMTAYGAPIKATAAGEVIRADMSAVYGRVIDIRHDNGITTRYAHMSAMEVVEGQRVTVEQLIGRVGTSGRSTGPHLHYETRVNDKPIDPYEFLRVARNVLQEKDQ